MEFRSLFGPPGLDRSLAWAEMTQLARLHSISLGIRHLRSTDPSYWWLDAVFQSKSKKDVGLPTMPVCGKTPFAEPADLAPVWEWVQRTTRTRSLQGPYLDEQLWCIGAMEPNVEKGMDANLVDAFNTLPGSLTGLHGGRWEDERTNKRGVTVTAQFSGREGATGSARAMVHSGSDEPKMLARVKAWCTSISSRQNVPLRWEE